MVLLLYSAKKKGGKIRYTIGINIENQILFSPSDVVGINIFGNFNYGGDVLPVVPHMELSGKNIIK